MRTSKPRRAKLTANVLSVVDEWQMHHRKRRYSLNLFVEALLDEVDWNQVKPQSLRTVFTAICEGLPTTDLADLSIGADGEREFLAELGDGDAVRAAREKVQAADPKLARLVDRLSPKAGRAAARLVKVLASDRAKARRAKAGRR